MSAIFIISLSIIILFCLWLKNHFNYWRRRGFPQINGMFPFGSLLGVGIDMCTAEKFDSFYQKFKGKEPIVGYYNFLSPAQLVISPDVAKTVLVREFSSFHNRGLFYNKKDDPISTNLVNLEGQEWKDRRIKLTPMFSSSKIKMMFEIVEMIGDQLVNALAKELGDQNMRTWAQRYTNDTIGNVAFGLEFGCLQNEESDFLKYGKRLFSLKPHEILKVLFTSELPKLGRKLKFRFMPKEAGDFFLTTFLQALEYREKNEINRNDFLSHLLKLKDNYTPTELAAEAFLIYIGGFETSSTLISYILYELSLDPEMQKRLRDEITRGMDGNDGKMTYDLITGFKYLDMIMNEALRKYPPIPNIFRKCTNDILLPETNYTITKGTTILINSFSMHYDPEYFPNPSKFDPERFSDENIKNIKPFTFLPFGEGQRNCIGMRFGQMQSKIGVAKLIRNFEFSVSEKTAIPVKFNPSSPFIEPQGGIWLKVEKITNE